MRSAPPFPPPRGTPLRQELPGIAHAQKGPYSTQEWGGELISEAQDPSRSTGQEGGRRPGPSHPPFHTQAQGPRAVPGRRGAAGATVDVGVDVDVDCVCMRACACACVYDVRDPKRT